MYCTWGIQAAMLAGLMLTMTIWVCFLLVVCFDEAAQVRQRMCVSLSHTEATHDLAGAGMQMV